MENSAPSGAKFKIFRFVKLWKEQSAAKPGLRIYENNYSIRPCWI